MSGYTDGQHLDALQYANMLTARVPDEQFNCRCSFKPVDIKPPDRPKKTLSEMRDEEFARSLFRDLDKPAILTAQIVKELNNMPNTIKGIERDPIGNGVIVHIEIAPYGAFESSRMIHARLDGRDLHAALSGSWNGAPYIPKIERVIFNDPATIVIWKDGTKTVVKCQPGETYDEEKGLALAISKKALGNQGNYNNVLKKYLPGGEQKK